MYNSCPMIERQLTSEYMFGDFCNHFHNQWIRAHDLGGIGDVGLSMLCMCGYACRNMFVSPVIHVCKSLELMMSDYWVDHLLSLRESVYVYIGIQLRLILLCHPILLSLFIYYHSCDNAKSINKEKLMIMHMHMHTEE